MPMDFQTIFSNRLDILYQQLKKGLFAPETAMMKRLIVVYGPAMKSWLMLKMAQDPEIGIATGIEFLYLNQAFEKIPLLFQPNNHKTIPSQLELALAIEQEIRGVLKEFKKLNHDEKKIWQPLIHYLKLTSLGRFSPKMEKRLTGLSLQLAKLFQDYGRFAGKVVCEWNKTQSHWQAVLWNKLFHKESNWHYLYQALQQPFNAPSPCQIHFFSISFMSNCEFQFIQRAAAHVPVCYYMISPCAVFWSDIRSDKETNYLRQRFSSQAEELEEFLRDRNPLLANFGRLGREMVSQIEESPSETLACYLLPSSVRALDEDFVESDDLFFQETQKPLSLLHAIQADMLLMRNPAGRQPFNIDHADRSIQLHRAPNRRREVEILYHNLLGLIDRDPTLEPRDIIVMAPQILDYVPYIQSVFGAKDSLLDCQILDLGLQTQSEIVQGFLQLLALSESRWDASHLLQLFEHSSFQRRHQLTTNDFHLIQKWVNEAGIRWGDDGLHRNEILQRRHCDSDMLADTSIGTWDYGLTRLLFGLTNILKSHSENPLKVSPCTSVEFSETELLGKWIRLLHSLRDDLSPFHDGSHLTVEDWTHYLKSLIENYFQQDYSQPQSIAEYDDLKAQFEILRMSSASFREATFPFQAVKTHLMNLFQQRGMTYRENYLQTVRFCSLIPLRSIPAKVIVLLGMHEGAFPRPAQTTSLNVVAGEKEADYCPMHTDYDRYLFLEALHTAQDFVLISYIGIDQKDSKELQPSIVIEELFSYLDRHYTLMNKKISDCCFYSHPFDSFDERYFHGNSELNNYSMVDYNILQTHLDHSKTEPHRFVDEFDLVECPLNEIIPHQQVIDLKQLCAAARDPIKFHLNKAMDIYLKDEEDRSCLNEEAFALSHLERYLIKKEALKQPLQAVLNHAELEGRMPYGVFKEIAVKNLIDEHHEIQESVFQIEFCSSCREPEQLHDGSWLLPPVTINFSDDHQVQVVGIIPQVTSKGMISLSNGKADDIWKIWPQLLLFQYACQNYLRDVESCVYFSKSNKTSPVGISDPMEYLKRYLRYYSLCFKNLSPLTPDWHHLILSEKVEELQKKIKGLFADFFTEYKSQEVRWVLNKDHLPDAELMIKTWKNEAELLVGDLIKEITVK